MSVELLKLRTAVGSAYSAALRKSPPGPPPRPGLEWKERTKRWIRPEREEGRESRRGAHQQATRWMSARDDWDLGTKVRISDRSRNPALRGLTGEVMEISDNPDKGVLVRVDSGVLGVPPTVGWISSRNLEVPSKTRRWQPEEGSTISITSNARNEGLHGQSGEVKRIGEGNRRGMVLVALESGETGWVSRRSVEQKTAPPPYNPDPAFGPPSRLNPRRPAWSE